VARKDGEEGFGEGHCQGAFFLFTEYLRFMDHKQTSSSSAGVKGRRLKSNR
jgi:hypothetical protein